MTLVQPTVEMQQHIRTELNEDVSTREKDLEHIKEWLRLQPHLPQFQGKLDRGPPLSVWYAKYYIISYGPTIIIQYYTSATTYNVVRSLD